MSLIFQTQSLRAYDNHSLPVENSLKSLINHNFLPLIEQTVIRTTEFIRGIEKKAFAYVKGVDVEALTKVILLIDKEGISPIQDALYKQNGYLSRWFSSESWEDWTEQRTALGRVVSLYSDCVSSSIKPSVFVKRLDPSALEVANQEAAVILKSLQTKRSSLHEPKQATSTWSSFLSLPMAEAASVNQEVFPAIFNLSSLNGANGFILNGESTYAQSGISVGNAGDINDDGISDLVIGSYGASGTGRAYVIFGSNRGWGSPLELSALIGTNGFILNGEDANDGFGYSVSGAGDINDDGVNDFIIGAFSASPEGRARAGKSYVIFGHRGRWTSPINLSELDGKNGFVLNGETAGDNSGISVSNAGDINADNITDIAVGAPGSTAYAGRTYVVFGSRDKWNRSIELSSLNGVNGFIINGEDSMDGSGNSVNGAGDINDDGIDDFVVGAYTASPNNRTYAGKSYVIFGNRRAWWSSPMDLSSLNGINGFVLYGEVAGDNSGFSVSSVGDINDDRIDDLIVGARFASPLNKTRAGKSYVIFGRHNPWNSPIELSKLNGKNGIIFNGESVSAMSGYSVSNAGDINDDGISDLIIGAPGALPAGKSYAIFGNRKTWSSPFNLSSLNGKNGFMINGEAEGDISGIAVAGAGDINSDGINDLAIGASSASPNNIIEAGKSYVVFGEKIN